MHYFEEITIKSILETSEETLIGTGVLDDIRKVLLLPLSDNGVEVDREYLLLEERCQWNLKAVIQNQGNRAHHPRDCVLPANKGP